MVDSPETGTERFGRQRRDDMPPPPKPTANPLILMALAIVISIVGTLYYLNSNVLSQFANKAEIQAQVTAVTDIASKLRTDMTNQANQLQTSIANGLSGIPNTITTQINTALSNVTSQISSMQSSVNDVKSQVSSQNTKIDKSTSEIALVNSKLDALVKADTDINSKITTLQTELAAAQTRITVLENSGGGGGNTVTNPLAVTIKTIANTLSLSQSVSTSGVTTTTTNTLSGSIRLSVANNSNKDINDAMLDIMFGFSPPIPNLNYTNSTATLVGGSVPFTIQLIDPNELEFYNAAWGLKVPSNQSLNLFLTLTIYYTASRDGNTTAYNPYNWATTYYYQVTADASN